LIKAVTFDLWNTIFLDKNYDDSRIVYLADVLRERKIVRGYNEISDVYLESHEYAHRIWEVENYRYVPAHERLNHVLERLRASLPENLKSSVIKEFEEAVLMNPPSLVEGAGAVLKSLNPQYRIGIICDTGMTPGRVLRKVLEKAQIVNYFESTIFSDEIGYNKPHRLVFETALKELRVQPSEAIHVGDLLETDIAGAKAMGMRAIWFSRKGLARTDLYSPDFEIHDLPQVIDILKEIH